MSTIKLCKTIIGGFTEVLIRIFVFWDTTPHRLVPRVIFQENGIFHNQVKDLSDSSLI